ncbi:DUF29 domain-containing protein [Kamptonema sp. UHCC 0994]|uniref:DUF29 domain-containing protein n=1 Tax=Kamptonema sp. UHCC 0994 TaxID=3031329 RepID=UPI0023B9460F|nr:DUF29 domain-containing protein [Kamptonema sp. UHCC 0994]MDF0551941.1 DUF29 domain-containing protein [Kamptonema sp. UHCC 0994]
MTTSQSVARISTLYERDFCLWAEEVAKLLREGKFSELDMENLIEEVEDMSRRQKDALRSNLRIILMHLLNYKYQSTKRSQSWLDTIEEHRIRLEDAFEESPSLRSYFPEVFDSCYQKARKQAAKETNLPIDTFPSESPFTLEECLDEDFLPN